MARVTKAADVRRQEFVDIAIDKFSQKDYSEVSVRDILKEVNGAPGMFYHHFDSKKQLFDEAVSQVIQRIIHDRQMVLIDDQLSFSEKLTRLSNEITQDIKQYAKMIDTNFKETLLTQVSEKLSYSFEAALRQALDKKEIKKSEYLSENNVALIASFFIGGAMQVIQSGSITTDTKRMTEILLTAADKLFDMKHS